MDPADPIIQTDPVIQTVPLRLGQSLTGQMPVVSVGNSLLPPAHRTQATLPCTQQRRQRLSSDTSPRRQVCAGLLRTQFVLKCSLFHPIMASKPIKPVELAQILGVTSWDNKVEICIHVVFNKEASDSS